MAHIIAVSNHKGGVGKTTTSVNLAACLGAAGYPTLLVDMDAQGSATSSFGLDASSTPSNLYRTLLGLDTPEPIDLTEKFRNVHILPSSLDLAGAELELLELDNREMRLKSVLEEVQDQYAYIILDSPPSLNLISLNILSAADFVLIPAQAEFMSLEGLARVIPFIQRIQESLNPDLDLLGVVVTMFDGRTRLANEVLDQLQANFGDKLFQSRIVRSIRLSEAPSHGLPIIYYDPKSAGALAYTKLAEELVHACEKARPGTWPRRPVLREPDVESQIEPEPDENVESGAGSPVDA